jgi:hypothetical protein
MDEGIAQIDTAGERWLNTVFQLWQTFAANICGDPVKTRGIRDRFGEPELIDATEERRVQKNRFGLIR